MRRKISRTMAFTLLVTNLNSLSFAELNNNNINDVSIEPYIDNTVTDTTVTSDGTIKPLVTSEPTGTIEVDINFSLPIKLQNSSNTNMKVSLTRISDKDGSKVHEAPIEVNLGSDNLQGSNYTLSPSKLDPEVGQVGVTTEGEMINFYLLKVNSLQRGTYKVEISGDGYESAVIDNLEIINSSKRISLGTSEFTTTKMRNGEPTDIVYNGVFLAGDVNADSLVTNEDYELVKNSIKSNSNNLSYDLNRDGKVDIGDLTYVHQNLGKTQSNPLVEKIDPIIDATDVKIDMPAGVKAISESGEEINPSVIISGEPVKFTKDTFITEESPLEIPMVLPEPVQMETISIDAPLESGPSSGQVVVIDENGVEHIVDFGDSTNAARNLKNTQDQMRNTDGKITVNLGQQIAVSKITIRVTGTRGNKNLAEIAKVEFLNNVYQEIPKPKMNIPVINYMTSKTLTGKEELVLGWNPETGVSSYEIKLELLDDNGNVKSTQILQTPESSITVKKVQAYETYRVSIQSVSGDWKSGYKDEQENYDATLSGDTNLLNNTNDKDGKPDNVDSNIKNQAWDSVSGLLTPSADSNVANANAYGQDSIIEVQIVPESKPDKTVYVNAVGLKQGLQISWGQHSQARDFDIYYRELGTKAFIKANDPNNNYVDTDVTNDIPDGVVNVNYSDISQENKDEFIKDTKYTMANLKDDASYEIVIVATNHHGSGILSEQVLGTTVNPTVPELGNFNRITLPKLDVADGESPVQGIVDITYPNKTGDVLVGDKFALVDNDVNTHWTSFTWNSSIGTLPTVTFDTEYEMDTLKFVTRLEPGFDHANASYYMRPFISYLDSETGNTVEIDKSDIKWSRKQASNGSYYQEISFPKIKTKQITFGTSMNSNYVKKLSISEVAFYKYDSLKNDVDGLFTDNLQLVLAPHVTQTLLNNLITHANTIDPVTSEENPNKEYALKTIARAQELLNDRDIKEELISLDTSIMTAWGNRIGQANDWQALGIAAKPGDTVNIYIGSSDPNVTLELGISQHFGESTNAFKTYSQTLVPGKNEIVIPQSSAGVDAEKGGSLYLRFKSGYQEVSTKDVKVRVSGGVEIPHLTVSDLMDDLTDKNTLTSEQKLAIETQVKDRIKIYLTDLKNYLNNTLPSLYTQAEDKPNNIYAYDPQTSIYNATEIEGHRFMLSLPADQVLKGIQSDGATLDAEVNRLYETLLTWEHIMQISYAQQGLIENRDINGDGTVSAEETSIYQSTIDGTNKSHLAPMNRMNIKYQRMFPGASMYAAPHHIGVGYGAAASAMKGKRFIEDVNGNVNTDGYYFGSIMGHEIGHVHDIAGLTYQETTNNILALINDTFNDINESDRLKNKWEEIYRKVTSHGQNTPQGPIALAMYWQLHLAYDDSKTYDMIDLNSDTDLTNDTFYAKLYRKTRELGIAPVEAGHEQTAQTFIMRSSDAVGKDLREFFRRWGVYASPNTNAYLDSKDYPKEERSIFYLNDFARRTRINNTVEATTMASDIVVNGNFGDAVNYDETKHNYVTSKEVPLKFSVDKDNDKVFGYEIIRRESTDDGYIEKPVGFVQRNSADSVTNYTDIIGSANNKVFEYKVKAYDYNLNESSVTTIGKIKVKHDGSLPETTFSLQTNTIGVNEAPNELGGHGPQIDGEITRVIDNSESTIYEAKMAVDDHGHTENGDPYVIIDLSTNKQVVGMKYTSGGNAPIGNYEVQVSIDGKNWNRAHSGNFNDISGDEKVIYFNELGDSTNTQLWAYDAKYVKLIAKGVTNMSIAELDVMAQPGDNVEIGIANGTNNYENGIGRLTADYEYAPGQVIPADSIVITGEYSGDPAFNVPLILNENGDNFALESQVILLANIPNNGVVGEVSNGTFLYWIEPSQQGDVMLDGVNVPNMEGTKVKAELYRYNKLDETGAPLNERLVSDSLLVDIDINNLPTLDLTSSNISSTFSKTRNTQQVTKVDTSIINKNRR